jgi:Ca2+:H+ antiporter
MHHVLTEVRRNPLVWLLAFVPALFIVESRAPDAATLKFVLMVYLIFARTLYLLPPGTS